MSKITSPRVTQGQPVNLFTLAGVRTCSEVVLLIRDSVLTQNSQRQALSAEHTSSYAYVSSSWSQCILVSHEGSAVLADLSIFLEFTLFFYYAFFKFITGSHTFEIWVLIIIGKLTLKSPHTCL